MNRWLIKFTLSLVLLKALKCRFISRDYDYDPYTDTSDFDTISRRLKLTKCEVDFMKSKFDLDSLDLVFPGNSGEVERQSQCLLSMNSVDDEIEFLVKLQARNVIGAWLRDTRMGKKSYCARDLANIRNNYEKLISMEYHAARMIGNRSGFFKFYSDFSLPLITSASAIGISPRSRYNNVQIMAYSFHPYTQDLKSWYMSHRSDPSVTQKLKNIFKQMHAALVYLLQHDLVYTDFKPENILVNLKNVKGSAFLTRLDSVVVTADGQQLGNICHISMEYFPPVFGAHTENSPSIPMVKLIDSFLKLETSLAVDRLLSWQFCLSIYSLICADSFKDSGDLFLSRDVFRKWKNDNQPFHVYFGCSGAKLSDDLYFLFEKCLYRRTKTYKHEINFKRLIENSWFE